MPRQRKTRLSPTAVAVLRVLCMQAGYSTPREIADSIQRGRNTTAVAHYLRVSRACNTLHGRGLIVARASSRGAILEYSRPADGNALAASLLVCMRETAQPTE